MKFKQSKTQAQYDELFGETFLLILQYCLKLSGCTRAQTGIQSFPVCVPATITLSLAHRLRILSHRDLEYHGTIF